MLLVVLYNNKKRSEKGRVEWKVGARLILDVRIQRRWTKMLVDVDSKLQDRVC